MCIEIYISLLQIQVHQGNFLNAQQNLEVGLSYNFEVRDHPLFHLINAKVQKDQGNINEAEKTLKKALELARKEMESKPKKPGSASGSKKIAFSTTDMATIYLELSDCYRIQGKDQEGTRLMQEGMGRFQVRLIELGKKLLEKNGSFCSLLGYPRRN